jgi:hypothetical protein
MSSQEAIELGLLNHDGVRAGATTQPVSPVSSGNRDFEPTELRLVQPSSSIFPTSDRNVQNAQRIPSWSNDRAPLRASRIPSSDEEGDDRTPAGVRKRCIPWTLRRTSLLGLIAFLIALIVALEVLHFFSNKNQGLVTADQDASYLWKYLPTASKYNLARRNHNVLWTVENLHNGHASFTIGFST